MCREAQAVTVDLTLQLSRETWAVVVAIVITLGVFAFVFAPRSKP